MSTDVRVNSSLNPAWLRAEAGKLMKPPAAPSPEGATPREKSIRRAHQVLAGDLIRLERLREIKPGLSYTDYFGSQLYEKIGAIIYLVQYKLLDIVGNVDYSRDILETRRQTTQYVDILYRLNAASALGVLYDFAVAHAKIDNASFWQKVSQHYLHLMAMQQLARMQVITFLGERLEARRQVEQLMASPDEAISKPFRALGEEYLAARKSGQPLPAIPIAEYLACFRQYDRSAPDAQTIGLTTLLAAQELIQYAVETADIPNLQQWFLDGSPESVRYLLHVARGKLEAPLFIDLLAGVIAAETGDVVRAATAVIELGKIDYAMRPNGGDPVVNEHLAGAALSDDEARAGIGRLIVQVLGAVRATGDILNIIDRAPLPEVAEEGILMLRDLRCLPLAESIVYHRPSLHEPYRKAQRYLQEVQHLMDAVWSCQNEQIAAQYIARLRELLAIKELETIAQKHKIASQLAKHTLTEVRLLLGGG